MAKVVSFAFELPAVGLVFTMSTLLLDFTPENAHGSSPRDILSIDGLRWICDENLASMPGIAECDMRPPDASCIISSSSRLSDSSSENICLYREMVLSTLGEAPSKCLILTKVRSANFAGFAFATQTQNGSHLRCCLHLITLYLPLLGPDRSRPRPRQVSTS